MPIINQGKPNNLIERLLGTTKKDTTGKVATKVDTTKTAKQIRQEKRDARRKEKEGG